MQKNTYKLVRAGVIGSLYIVLSFITFPVSGGAIQFRVSEGLTILPLFFIESVPALFVGCFLFNLISGLPFYDVALGSLVTLVAAVATYLVGKIIKKHWIRVTLGGFFPVILNALILPLVWYYFSGGLQYVYIVSVAFLLISQSVSIYLIGSLIYAYITKLQKKDIKFLK